MNEHERALLVVTAQCLQRLIQRGGGPDNDLLAALDNALRPIYATLPKEQQPERVSP